MKRSRIDAIKRAMQIIFIVSAVGAAAVAAYPQTPALPPQDFRSPDRRYEWRIEAGNPVRYELLADAGRQRVLTTVNDYFHNQGHALAMRHAQRVRAYWNERSDLVALDEFDYRRAGRLYLFSIQNGKARPVSFDGLVTLPGGASEARFCVRQGWKSATQLSIRLAARLNSGEVINKGYVIDAGDPTHPKVQAEP